MLKSKTKGHYDAVVFDLDGTLVESKAIKTEAFARLYAPYGVEVVEAVVAWHQTNEGVSRFLKFKHWEENLLHRPYTEAVGQTLSAAFSKQVLDLIIDAPYIAGAHEFLESHYKALPLFVASGTPNDELHTIIKLRGMAHYFQGVYGTPKTKAEILAQIIDAHDWRPERVLMVGDALADWEGAHAVGADFLGVQADEVGPLSSKGSILKNLEGMANYIVSEPAHLEVV